MGSGFRTLENRAKNVSRILILGELWKKDFALHFARVFAPETLDAVLFCYYRPLFSNISSEWFVQEKVDAVLEGKK